MGAEFLFAPQKSGRHYVRRDRLSRVPRLTQPQRAVVTANFEAGRPIFSSVGTKGTVPFLLPRCAGAPQKLGQSPRLARKIVYAAPHCLIDPTSGAAVATAQGLRFLQTLGFQCRAFCGSQLDLPEEIEAMLRRHQIVYRHEMLSAGSSRLPVLVASLHGSASSGAAEPLEVAIFPDERQRQTDFYRACGAFLDAGRPDAVVTYGGDPLAETLILLAKNRDLPLVFWLHNFAYHDPQAFALADYVIVPSETARRHYWGELGLACQHLPYFVDWPRVEAIPAQPRFLTFINPQATKGLFVFARIAEVLANRRPDIPVLVVEKRAHPEWVSETGIDLGGLPNVTVRPATSDPREFYAATKLLLMPSLWKESFGLVAAEAMINGIPVLASNRGTLPETIGDAGFLFDIPARYTPATRDLPTSEEVEPWVETITRLWDDAAEYEHRSRAARERAQQWHPDRLAPIYRDFFTRITHQPGPPLVPCDVAKG